MIIRIIDISFHIYTIKNMFYSRASSTLTPEAGENNRHRLILAILVLSSLSLTCAVLGGLGGICFEC